MERKSDDVHDDCNGFPSKHHRSSKNHSFVFDCEEGAAFVLFLSLRRRLPRDDNFVAKTRNELITQRLGVSARTSG